MIKATSRRLAAARRDSLLEGDAASRDDESQLAAALRPGKRSEDDAPPRPHQRRSRRPAPNFSVALPGQVAVEIANTVESRLPGRIRDLRVRFEEDQFVLSGVSSSYYVKQVAQHVAMNALNALMLGRLVNDIKVHSMR
jgi:hypothetical protein